MRHALLPLIAVLVAPAAVAAPDPEVLLFDDAEERARRVNEGELVLLATPPERPVHHHMTRLEITRDGLASGWVTLQQCHEGLDRVPDAQIVYQPGKLRRLEEVLATMGQVVAWAHLRSAGRQGSAIADAFVDFGQQTGWQKALIDHADAAAASVVADWQAYAAAFDAGYFG